MESCTLRTQYFNLHCTHTHTHHTTPHHTTLALIKSYVGYGYSRDHTRVCKNRCTDLDGYLCSIHSGESSWVHYFGWYWPACQFCFYPPSHPGGDLVYGHTANSVVGTLWETKKHHDLSLEHNLAWLSCICRQCVQNDFSQKKQCPEERCRYSLRRCLGLW